MLVDCSFCGAHKHCISCDSCEKYCCEDCRMHGYDNDICVLTSCAQCLTFIPDKVRSFGRKPPGKNYLAEHKKREEAEMYAELAQIQQY